MARHWGQPLSEVRRLTVPEFNYLAEAMAAELKRQQSAR